MKLRNSAGIYYFQKKKYLAVDNFVDEDVAKIITEEYLEKARQDTENELNDRDWETRSYIHSSIVK